MEKHRFITGVEFGIQNFCAIENELFEGSICIGAKVAFPCTEKFRDDEKVILISLKQSLIGNKQTTTNTTNKQTTLPKAEHQTLIQLRIHCPTHTQ